MHALDLQAAERIHKALLTYIGNLERAMGRATAAGLGTADQLQRMVRANTVLARRMNAEIAAMAATGRHVSFETTLAIWADGLRQVAAATGAGSLVGGLATAPVSMMGVWEAIGAPTTWRTLLAGHVAAGGAEVSAIVTQGIANGMDPEDLARGLRKYVVGSEPFKDAFVDGRIDLRKLPAAQRGAARRMTYNARRIAFSEMHQARKEAEVQHALLDPHILGMQWVLAPDRGALLGVDECDVLAASNFYGLGRGVFPPHRVPPEPHPFGRCEIVPVTRLKNLDKPKPDPILAMDPDKGRLPSGRGAIRPAQAARARARAGQAVRYGRGDIINPLDPAA
jgi:hypothetical protein